MREKPGQYIDSASPFCRNCTRDDCPTNGDGCKAWEAYFVANWNENIMKSMSMSKAKMYGCFKPVKNCTPPRWGKVPRGNKGKQKGN